MIGVLDPTRVLPILVLFFLFVVQHDMVVWNTLSAFFKTSRLKRLSSALGASVQLSKNCTTGINHCRTCQFMLCCEG